MLQINMQPRVNGEQAMMVITGGSQILHTKKGKDYERGDDWVKNISQAQSGKCKNVMVSIQTSDSLNGGHSDDLRALIIWELN